MHQAMTFIRSCLNPASGERRAFSLLSRPYFSQLGFADSGVIPFSLGLSLVPGQQAIQFETSLCHLIRPDQPILLQPIAGPPGAIVSSPGQWMGSGQFSCMARSHIGSALPEAESANQYGAE